MSADAFADSAGRVTVRISDYRDDRKFVIVTLDGLVPFRPVAIELVDGTDYLPDYDTRLKTRAGK